MPRFSPPPTESVICLAVAAVFLFYALWYWTHQ
jgi:hypothetical protein